MSDQTNPPVIIDEVITNLADITNLLIAQATTAVTNMSIDNTTFNTNTDSTGSLPDLKPVTDGESDTNASTNREMHHPLRALPVVPIDPQAVNGIVNPNQLMINNIHGS
jgi:hypothetical protein